MAKLYQLFYPVNPVFIYRDDNMRKFALELKRFIPVPSSLSSNRHFQKSPRSAPVTTTQCSHLIFAIQQTDEMLRHGALSSAPHREVTYDNDRFLKPSALE